MSDNGVDRNLFVVIKQHLALFSTVIQQGGGGYIQGGLCYCGCGLYPDILCKSFYFHGTRAGYVSPPNDEFSCTIKALSR